MEITLYTTHCPRCTILEKKLNEKKLSFNTFEDVNEMIKLGFTTVPILKVDDILFNFSDAIKWINEVEI